MFQSTLSIKCHLREMYKMKFSVAKSNQEIIAIKSFIQSTREMMLLEKKNLILRNWTFPSLYFC